MNTTAVELAVAHDQTQGATLIFGDQDLQEVLPAGAVPADVVLRTSASVLAAGRTGGQAGSGLVRSGTVTAEPESWELLAGLRGRLAGTRFAQYTRDITMPRGGPPTEVRDDPWIRADLEGGSTAVVSLGAANDDAGRIDRIGSDRLRLALRMTCARPGACLVLTGGFGNHFNRTDTPHWEHCKRWIRSRFPGFTYPLAFVQSAHTYEDLLLLRELARGNRFTEVFLVTSDFHAERVRTIADLVLPGCRIATVHHAHLSKTEHEFRITHEARSVGMTVAAALLFGPDRLCAPAGSYGWLSAAQHLPGSPPRPLDTP